MSRESLPENVLRKRSCICNFVLSSSKIVTPRDSLPKMFLIGSVSINMPAVEISNTVPNQSAFQRSEDRTTRPARPTFFRRHRRRLRKILHPFPHEQL